MKIGIVGFGFVGKAVYYGFKDQLGGGNILINDVAKPDGITICPIRDLVNYCPIIFVCVPTPTDVYGGNINTDIVSGVIKNINSFAGDFEKRPVVVLKSTIIPGSCRWMQEVYQDVDIVFNPEFLTEKNYISDFKNQKHIVIGGNNINASKQVVELYKNNGFEKTLCLSCSWEEAEMTKYVMNCFLASKVALFNEFYKICKASNIDYQMVKTLVGYDERIGTTHMDVPGHDGDFGFGGKCFPKDLLALIDLAKDRQVNPQILQQVWEFNLQMRSDRNWLNIPGAVE
jgi:UDPglucose 6-dehydrogenase